MNKNISSIHYRITYFVGQLSAMQGQSKTIIRTFSQILHVFANIFSVHCWLQLQFWHFMDCMLFHLVWPYQIIFERIFKKLWKVKTNF